MNKEQTEEQVQDHLHEDTGGSNTHHPVKRSERCKTLFWITLAFLVASVIVIILFAT